MTLMRRLGGHGFAAAGEALALLLLSPLAVSFIPRVPYWDELYFFHRAACIRNAVQHLSWPMADSCLNGMTKSPILATMLLASAPLNGPESIAVAPVMLSLLSFALLWLGIRLAQQGGMRLPMAVLAAFVAVLAPPLWAGAPFLGDELVAIVILNTMLLPLVETAAPGTTSREAIRRGMLWGLVFSLGVLTKLTYLYFAGVIFGGLTLLSLWQSGLRLTAWKLLGMALVCLLPGAVFARYGWIYWGWAMSAAFGPISTFYNVHLQRWPFLVIAFQSLGFAYWLGLAALFSASALLVWRMPQRRPMLVCGFLLLVIGGYLFISSGSPNKDPRFFWPIWLSLPFCVAALGARLPSVAPTPVRGIGLLPVWLMITLSIATSGRFDMRAVTQADLILRTIPHVHPATVLLAMDEPDFNVETFTLARQLDLPQLEQLTVGTVVYDVVAGKSAADSIRRLSDADYVILRDPIRPGSPEWANRNLSRFAAAVQAKGRLVGTFPGEEETRIYAMH